MWESDRRLNLLGKAAFTHALERFHISLLTRATQQEVMGVRPVYRRPAGHFSPSATRILPLVYVVPWRSCCIHTGGKIIQELGTSGVQIQNANIGIKNRLLVNYSAFVKETRLTS